ncbi:hypothetical protein [Pseudomonas sp. MWU15-20650]|nr:hypothetical protein [Pseudomonas sp. MWU15-20650]
MIKDMKLALLIVTAALSLTGCENHEEHVFQIERCFVAGVLGKDR